MISRYGGLENLTSDSGMYTVMGCEHILDKTCRHVPEVIHKKTSKSKSHSRKKAAKIRGSKSQYFII